MAVTQQEQTQLTPTHRSVKFILNYENVMEYIIVLSQEEQSQSLPLRYNRNIIIHNHKL